MAFSIDLPGRIRNIDLPKSNCLHPLFEAIVNSIHAINEVRGRPRGTITVRMVRSNEQAIMRQDGSPINAGPLTGFTVEDDGIGFTEDNFASFLKSDTTRKKMKGGKGVGRFLWLKAFDSVKVESVYREKNQWLRREFDFLNSELGVENESVGTATEAKRRTVVHLRGMKSPYIEECTKTPRSIAREIIKHCILYMIIYKCPNIIVEDSCGESGISLEYVFQNDIRLGQQSTTIGIDGRNLRITHLLTKSSEDAAHRLYYCAHDRAVSFTDMKSRIPNLTKGLFSPKHAGSVYYTGLVSGEYLDERVSPDRTKFERAADIFSDSPDVLQWREIATSCISEAKRYLSPLLAPVQRRKEEQIRRLVRMARPEIVNPWRPMACSDDLRIVS